MKKIFSVLIAICAMFLFTGIGADCAVNKKINANIKTKRVPAGTVITLKVLDPVGSSTSSLGDQFDLMVTENIKLLLIREQPEVVSVFAAVQTKRIKGMPVGHSSLWMCLTKRFHFRNAV